MKSSVVAKVGSSTLNSARWGHNIEQLDELDAWSSEWNECKKNGEVWGGRSKGGRGVRVTKGNVKDIHVEGVTLQFVGKVLLNSSSLILLCGHKYGLIGHNGSGKSTLLRRLAKKSIPGVLVNLKIVYMQQELPETINRTVMQYLKDGYVDDAETEDIRLKLEKEEKELNELLESTSDSTKIEEIAEQLCEIAEELENLDTRELTISTEDDQQFILKNQNILQGLGLIRKNGKSDILNRQMKDLSGGWRVRATLALTLIEAKKANILLLDEPSNHLDLKTSAWLRNYLAQETSHLILVLVSHDRLLLEDVCTDIVHIHEKVLNYFSGTYNSWITHNEEMKSFHENRLDGQRRREEQIKKSVGSGTSESQIKKKLERNSMHRAIDGKKFKNFSLKKLSEDAVHVAETETFSSKGDKDGYSSNHFKFHSPDLIHLRLSTPTSPLLRLDDCSVSWISQTDNTIDTILSKVTFEICPGSRIAIVGMNGQGKSTLMTAIATCCDYQMNRTIKEVKKKHGLKVENSSDDDKDDAVHEDKDIDTSITNFSTLSIELSKQKISKSTSASISVSPSPIVSSTNDENRKISSDGQLEVRGRLYANRNLKVGYLTQHHIDTMFNHLDLNVVQYLNLRFDGKVMSDLEARSHVGRYGLSGNTVLNPLSSLSGGQKARLALAAACLEHPHVLLLDEPTNHLSIEAIEALVQAIQSFEGAVVTISHNQWFLRETCTDLLIVQKGSAFITRQLIPSKSDVPKVSSSSSISKSNKVEKLLQTSMESYTFSEILTSYIHSL